MKKINKTGKFIYFFTSMIFFIIFDLYFSELIINSLRYELPENKVLNLTFLQNTGAAFSIMENANTFLMIFSIIIALFIIGYFIKNSEKFSFMSCFWSAMLVAGICCNTYERILYGYVRDFFSLGFVNFPVFNISDVFINIGALALIVIILKNNYLKNENSN